MNTENKFPQFSEEAERFEKIHPASEHQRGIVFYGASNFRLWYSMESDLSKYKVLNHGFGGATDEALLYYAPRLLYPYAPKMVFFQTGSNDYVDLQGSEEEIVKRVIAQKDAFYQELREHLPAAVFVVMSGLLLPGRAQFTSLSQKINAFLKDYCEAHKDMYFVDSSSLTYENGKYRTELFVEDQFHFNSEGQKLWREGYIRPKLQELIEQYGYTDLLK